jgi:hypothetical protein
MRSYIVNAHGEIMVNGKQIGLVKETFQRPGWHVAHIATRGHGVMHGTGRGMDGAIRNALVQFRADLAHALEASYDIEDALFPVDAISNVEAVMA